MSFKKCLSNDPNYLEATFNGLPCYIQSDTLSVNPGSAKAEFIYVNKPASADTSKNADEYSFEAYLTGEDIIGQANAWRAVASGPQPFTIVHPVFGVLIAGGTTIKFENDYVSESDVIKVSFDGFEWGEMPSSGFGLGAIFSAVESLIDFAATSFADRYSFQGVPVWQLPRIEAAYNGALQSILTGLSATGEPLAVPRQGLWQDDSNAWSGLSGNLLEVSSLSASTAKAMKHLVADLGVSVHPGPTQSAIDAIYHSTRLLAIIALGNATMAQTYLSPGQVIDARDAVAMPLLAEFRAATIRGDTGMMKAIDDYRRAFINEMTAVLSTKPPLVIYKFPQTTSSIKVAHEVYGDATRFKEIEALNPQMSPLLMRGDVYALAS